MRVNDVNATIAAVKKAQAAPITTGTDIERSFTQATGLVNYDLQAPALSLYPVLTPLRNRIPRVGGGGDTATRWKAITGINTGNTRAGVSEGNRGGIVATSVVDKTAAYKGIGLEDNVTFEAQYASEGFDDARARAVMGLLNSVMIQEERVIWGGNASLALGVTPTPAVAGSASGGTLATATYSIICVALSHIAAREATVSGGITLTGNRTNADGSVDSIKGGHAGKSAAASQAITGPTGSITATVNASAGGVNGACAYAWYWGTAGNEVLGAITTINSVLITAAATGTQNASAVSGTDQSQDSLVFDGLLTQIMTPGSNAYNVALPTGTAGVGTVLTGDGAGGCTQVNAALMYFWNNYRLSPSRMLMTANTLEALNKVVLANGGAPLIRYALDASGNNVNIEAGAVISSYLNKATNQRVQIEVHPEATDGMITFMSDSVPYPLNGIGNILQIKTRRDYYQTEWPLRTRKYEFGVYADELLQCYFPPAFGVLKNIAVG